MLVPLVLNPDMHTMFNDFLMFMNCLVYYFDSLCVYHGMQRVVLEVLLDCGLHVFMKLVVIVKSS